MLSVAFGGLESWQEAAGEMERAVAEAVALWNLLQGAGALFHAHKCYKSLQAPRWLETTA
jgi:hypothetical protein